MGERMRLRGRTKLALGAVLAAVVCVFSAFAGDAVRGGAPASHPAPNGGPGGAVTGGVSPCAGSGGNDVFNVYSASSAASLLPNNTATNVVAGFPRDVNHAIDLNSFYGYGPAINRSTGVRGQFVTDPSCIYDAATQRFFLVVLTINPQVPGPCQGVFSCVNHLDLAVSQTSNPTGSWNIYRLDVTNDGTNAGGSNPGPYLGDYPHIGADANGIYLTTNAYPWHGNGFAGAQIYALSKAQLAAGAAHVTMQHIDTFGMVNVPSDAGSTQPGFTVWPAQSPGTTSFNPNAGGTEDFISSNP